MDILKPIEGWMMPAGRDGFKPIAEVGDDGIALSWSCRPDELDGMDGDNWTDQPEIPWPFSTAGDERIPYAVAIRSFSALGFHICEY